MSQIPARPVTPILPWRHVIDEPGDYVVVVDVNEATRSVVWQDNQPCAAMARYRRPGRHAWFTVLADCPAGAVVQLETDGHDPTFTISVEADSVHLDLPPIGIAVA